ncbi:MAG: hypothetical protein NTV58_18680 [Deltaproteobacteria bacterium]|nr:hypothetical protein [Deltaproteobacteria bacterium]
MQAYKIHKLVIAADIKEDACDFYREEIGGTLPDVIEELPSSMEVCCDDGTFKTIKARINEELDNRNTWLRLGVPCDLHWPFVIGTLP